MDLKIIRGAVVTASLFGFSMPGSARASSSSGSSSSGSSDSSNSDSNSGSSSSGSSSSGSSGSAIATTVITSGVTLVAGVIITVLIVANNNRRNKGWVDDKDPRVRALALLETGLVDTRTDLGVEIGVLLTDPAAFDRVNDDVQAGGGPALSALAEAAGLSSFIVAKHWEAAVEEVGAITSQDSANRFGAAFVVRLARDLQLDPNMAGAFLWELSRERARPGFPSDSPTHSWLATWMGIPMASAVMGTEFALAGTSDMLEAEARTLMYEQPTFHLERLAADIGLRHPKEVDRRIRGLAATIEPWMPPIQEPTTQPIPGPYDVPPEPIEPPKDEPSPTP